MAKHKTKELTAVTEAARVAGNQLSAWGAVEARAKSILAATETKEAARNYAEFHFKGVSVMGLVKAGELVLKIEG